MPIGASIDFLEGRYRCYRGWFDTEIAQSAVDVAAVAKDQYHWFELKVTIDASSGAVELRRNGAPLLTFAGNTKAAPTGDITRIQLRSMNQSSNYRVDVSRLRLRQPAASRYRRAAAPGRP